MPRAAEPLVTCRLALVAIAACGVGAAGAAERVAGAAERVAGPLREAGPGDAAFVGYVDSATLPVRPFDRWPGVSARVLGEDVGSGRLAVRADFPPGWRLEDPPRVPQSLEIVLLEGSLGFGAERLGRHDFAFVPPGSPAPPLSSPSGAGALLFFDPPAPDAAAVARQRARGAYVSRFDPQRWQPASLARAAGATLDLRVMHLKKDPFTSARTWYVRLGRGMRMPWEVHSMVEEGYVMEGGYTLAECLPTRTVIGRYGQGGYFWRPGGIPHGGPESGPDGAVMWLQRSPVALDVALFRQCADGRAGSPLQPP
jgi:hypothetical protein